MKKLFSNLQLHFFTDNSDLPATSAVIKEVMSNLDSFDLMPTFGNEFVQQTNETRKFVCMVTSDETFKVQFLSNDIFISAENYDLESFVTRSLQILDSLSKLYSQKRASRISILSTEAFESSISFYDSVFSKLFVDDSSIPFEWDNRVVRKIQSFEQLNSVEVVTRVLVQPPMRSIRKAAVDALVFDFDVNTEFENQNERFSLQNVKTEYQCILKVLMESQKAKFERIDIQNE
ncbi:hypothetical protein [Photobacterium leiognathi]|uniref:hypothetical protein n=1 Tax=Photobacterium leiognathi TaxID=553611 RepID=UPI0012D9FA56|nr:hypothetical protein [Photobacterium leiognathi]